MTAVAVMLLTIAVLLVFYAIEHRQHGRYENSKVQPPEIPEASPWITFRMRDGVIHIRAEEVRNFAYNYSQMTLVINDGTESPAVIPDPGYRHYARLCQRFGCLPMAKTLKGGRGRD